MARTLLVVGALAAMLAIPSTAADPSVEDLRAALLDTRWQWNGDGGETVHLRENGRVENPGWTARGLVTSWTEVDRRTVLLRIEEGRAEDRYAILTFSEDGTAFTGHDFHRGRTIPASARIE